MMRTLALVLALAGTARAEPGKLSAQEVLGAIGFEQRLGERVPLDLAFRDAEGREAELAAHFGGLPVVLNLVYFDCPMLCPEASSSLVRALRVLEETPGREFRVLTVSFSARETPQSAKQSARTLLRRYGRPGAERGWRFLTGDAEAVEALTRAVGFRFVYDAGSGQFAHSTGLVVLTPEGKVSRYLFGLDYGARDLKLALAEASGGRVGGLAEKLLLVCYAYDPATGRYGPAIMRALRAAGASTALALLGFIGTMAWRERRRRRP